MSTLAAGPRARVTVGLGRIAASATRGEVLTALGLGSCIGLVVADPRGGVVGMAHVMLPQASPGSAPGPPGKYADTAVPALIEAVVALGADAGLLAVAIAGGARMFAGSRVTALDIGARNAAAVRAALAAAGLSVRAADTGGSAGRAMQVVAGSGLVTVRRVGSEPRVL